MLRVAADGPIACHSSSWFPLRLTEEKNMKRFHNWAASGLASLLALLSASVQANTMNYPFTISKQQSGYLIELIAENKGPAPISISMSLTKANNINSNQHWPFTAVAPAHSRVQLAAITPKNPHDSSFVSYAFKYQLGDTRAQPDLQFPYHLPFPPGQPHLISQAYGGFLPTHNTPSAYYAVDIVMPRGTPILAARAGKVIEVVQKFGEGGRDPRYLDRANYVRILQADGTMAEYVHLTKDSVRVHPGEEVQAGQMLGLSGNSGFTSGPHLHFNIERNKDGQILSVPFFFTTADHKLLRPREGEYLAAE